MIKRNYLFITIFSMTQLPAGQNTDKSLVSENHFVFFYRRRRKCVSLPAPFEWAVEERLTQLQNAGLSNFVGFDVQFSVWQKKITIQKLPVPFKKNVVQFKSLFKKQYSIFLSHLFCKLWRFEVLILGGAFCRPLENGYNQGN